MTMHFYSSKIWNVFDVFESVTSFTSFTTLAYMFLLFQLVGSQFILVVSELQIKFCSQTWENLIFFVHNEKNRLLTSVWKWLLVTSYINRSLVTFSNDNFQCIIDGIKTSVDTLFTTIQKLLLCTFNALQQPVKVKLNPISSD